MKRLVIPVVVVTGLILVPLTFPGGGPLGRISVAKAGGVPTLAGEVFQASTFTIISGSCQSPDQGNSVINFTATGTAKGPVSGTYTQNGTITTGNNQSPTAQVITQSVSGSFTITGSNGSTTSGSVNTAINSGAPGPGIDLSTPTGSTPFGYCVFPQLNVDTFVDYTATVGNTMVSAEAELTVSPAGSPTQSNFQQTFLTSTTISCLTSIDMPFDGTAIPAGDTIWMPAVVDIHGKGNASPATINFRGQSITLGATGTPISVPDGSVIFSASATAATTTYGPNGWTTTVPVNVAGRSFFTGVAIPVPAPGLPGGTKPVTWSGQISSPTPGVEVHWQWGATVYTTFSADYTTLGVTPANDGGTPQNEQQFATGGARNSGWSATGKCTT
jgi:hypothetical protein